MSEMDTRGSFFPIENVRNNREYDILKTEINRMSLRTSSLYRITSATENRMDLISQIHFGSYNYGWLISLHNNFLDPFNDYYAGRVINIPSMEGYYRFYNRHSVKRA